MKLKLTTIVCTVCFCVCSLCAAAQIPFTGVNLSGPEFDSPDNMYPLQSEVVYFQNREMNIIRLPVKWERLQPVLFGQFDSVEFSNLLAFVSYATGRGLIVIIDIHNYSQYAGNEIGSPQVPVSAFADLWSRLATDFGTNDHVWFGLMNEPNGIDATNWLNAATTAISAIRSVGARNAILIPGTAWTGAHSWTDTWYGTPNAVAMRNITDPGTNFIEFHEYFDGPNYSGVLTNMVSPAEAVGTFTNSTLWLRTNHLKGFLAEFAVANITITNGMGGGILLSNVLSYLQSNSDVWVGWTWWAGGPKWPGGPAYTGTNAEYLFLLDPTNLDLPNQIEKPAMVALEPFIQISAPDLAVIQGDQYQFTVKTNRHYQPQFTPNLATGTWTNFGSAITGANQLVSLDLTNFSAQGFFRLQVTRSP
jgi:endoglucanase